MFTYRQTKGQSALFSTFRSSTVPLHLVTGFLEAGKTAFIAQSLNLLAQQSSALHILYVTNEQGNQKLFSSEKPLLRLPLQHGKVVVDVYAHEAGFIYVCVLQPQNGSEWQERLWEELAVLPSQLPSFKVAAQSETRFEYCFVELNGSFVVDAFWVSLPKRYFRLVQSYYLQDIHSFQRQFQALGDMVRGNLVQSGQLILTSDRPVLPVEKAEALRQLKSLNPRAKRFVWTKNEDVPLPPNFLQRETAGIGFKLITAGLGLWMFFILWQFLRLPSMASLNVQVQQTARFFLSLLFQILPFLLISAFVSSVLQLWVKEDTIYRLFKRRSWLALPLTMSAGFVLPICDCGLIPIVTRLRKKGLPLPYVMLFFVSATVTNPLVLVSTVLAFPGQQAAYVYRLGLTWSVGLLLAAVFYLWERRALLGSAPKAEQVAILNCASGYLGRVEGGLQWKRFSVIMRHTAQEFMTLLSYIIPGVFSSAVIHAFVQAKMDLAWRNQPIWQWAALLLAVFFMSVCANSNAFIAKSFAGVFSFPVLLIYMVFSPLLDLKNLLLFRNGFGGRLFWQYVIWLLVLLHFFFMVAQCIPAGFFPRFGLGVPL